MSGSRFSKSLNRQIAVLGGALVFLLFSVAVAQADSSRPSPRFVSNPQPNHPNGLSWSSVITDYVYLPMVMGTAGYVPELYDTVAVITNPACPTAPTDPPAENNADINLAVRGSAGTTGTLGLVDYGGHVDVAAPQLYTLFGDSRTPAFSAVYQVYDWVSGHRGDLIADPVVTLAGMVVAQGELIRVPSSGYDIGKRPAGYSVMVLYAAANRITLKYTREDNMVCGYGIHIENISVDSNLLALYQAMNAAGRTRLPALYAGQIIGRALTTELGVAVRDTGSFMDSRSRKDWWQGR